MKIIAVKTNTGYYITEDCAPHSYPTLGTKLINGNPAVKTWKPNWYYVEGELKTISYKRTGTQINFRYEIIDPELVSDKIKASYTREEMYFLDEDGCWECKSEYWHLASLYALKYDTEPPIEEFTEFEMEVVMEIEFLNEPKKLEYNVQKTRWSHEGTVKTSNHQIQNALLDTIIYPDIAIHTRPSKLSSVDSYNIVRQYIKENINPEYAVIASDYNFCFSVKKKIWLDEVEEYKIDVNSSIFGKRKRKPKMETRFRKHREVTIFEMTHDVENYKGYTVLKGFEGKDHEDLINNIQIFLDNVIKEINKPIHDCDKCHGLGVLMD